MNPISKLKVSSLELDIQRRERVSEPTERETFHKNRNGQWSGMVIKELMKCNPKGGKMDWGNEYKTYAFADSIIPLIYSKVKQRLSGKYIESGSTTEMKYGSRVEPLILTIGGEKLEGDIEPCEYKKFPDFPTAGCTADSVLRVNGKVAMGVEAKGCTNWNTHFKRTFEPMDDKSVDFWQTQAECKAWEVDECIYLVSEPPQEMGKYLYYDGDIMDMLDEFRNECPVSVIRVKPSEIHIREMMKRLEFVEGVVSEVMEVGIDKLKDVYYRRLDEVKGVKETKAMTPESHVSDLGHVVDQVGEIQVIDHIEVTPDTNELLKDGENHEDILDDLPF